MMNYPMKKRIWINNERLDIWEQNNNEVTVPGKATILVNDGNDVIVRIFGRETSITMPAGGIAIDPFNGHLVILKHGTPANVTDINIMDETAIDIDPYFTSISYTEPDVMGVCVVGNCIKPALGNPENAIIVTVSLISVPAISDFDVDSSDDLVYPIAWHAPARECKSMCDKLGRADKLPNHFDAMYTMINEYIAPIYADGASSTQLKLRKKFESICSDVSMSCRTHTGIRKGSFVLMRSGAFCQVTEKIQADDYLIKLNCLPDGINLKYYPYEFMESLVAVLPDRLRIVASDWYAKSVIMDGNPKEIITKPFNDVIKDKVSDLRMMIVTRVLPSGELITNDDKIVNLTCELSQDLNLGKEIYVKLGQSLYEIRISQNKSGNTVSIKEVN